SIAGDDVLEMALERGGARGKPGLVAVEAAGLVAMQMLEQDGILTIGAVAMPGSAPAVRLMMYPDGPRLGIEPIVASLERSIDRLSRLVHDVPAARSQPLGGCRQSTIRAAITSRARRIARGLSLAVQ